MHNQCQLGDERRVADAVQGSVKVQCGQVVLAIGKTGDWDRDGAQHECSQSDEDSALAAPHEAPYGQSGRPGRWRLDRSMPRTTLRELGSRSTTWRRRGRGCTHRRGRTCSPENGSGRPDARCGRRVRVERLRDDGRQTRTGPARRAWKYLSTTVPGCRRRRSPAMVEAASVAAPPMPNATAWSRLAGCNRR
jgi:hypothetical protein